MLEEQMDSHYQRKHFYYLRVKLPDAQKTYNL